MKIKLYDKYLHKSRMFCYPLIGIRRKAEIIPSQTFMSWNGLYKANDLRLVCHYSNCNSPSFNKFSKEYLESNRLFEKRIKLETDQFAYVFDFSTYEKDWQCILSGKYSKLSNDYKKQVLKFFLLNKDHFDVIKKILYPTDHYTEFASMLNVSTELISNVGEVLDLPDLNREAFTFELVE